MSTDRPATHAVYPTPNGGLVFEWSVGDYEVSVEHTMLGQLSFHATNIRTAKSVDAELLPDVFGESS